MAEMNVQLYWGSRAEDLEALIQKMRRHFVVVTGLGPSFETWVQPGKSKKSALKSTIIDLADAERLQELLLRGQSTTDTIPRTPIFELGYGIRLWNLGRGDVDATIALRSGVNSEFLSQDAQNLMNLTANTVEALLPSDAAIKEAFRVFADIWSPQGGRAWIKQNDSQYIISEV